MYLSALSFPKKAFATVKTLYGVHVTMKASKIALNVFAAFRSFFFSLKWKKTINCNLYSLSLGTFSFWNKDLYQWKIPYLVFLGFCPVFKFPFFDPDTTAAWVDAIPDTVVAAIAAIPVPELTTFLFAVLPATELLPLLSCETNMRNLNNPYYKNFHTKL